MSAIAEDQLGVQGEELDIWGVPFAQLALPANRSPIAASADLRVGGNTLFILGSPGMGKSVLAYMFARARSDRMRLWVRGTMDYTWHEAYGRDATVWVTESETPTVEAYRGGERARIRDPPDVRRYSDFKDLMDRAEAGKANVLYWPGETGLEQWLRFCWALRHRDDALPQLLLDDEFHEIAPARGSSPDPEDYRRMSIARRILADSRKADMSWILSSHQSHDIDYSALGKGHYYCLLTGARVPKHLPSKRFDPEGIVERATRGEGVMGGPTAHGFQWEIFHFQAPPELRDYRLRVRFPGAAEDFPELNRQYRGTGGTVSKTPEQRQTDVEGVPELLRRRDVSRILGVSRGWIRGQELAGRLHPMRVGVADPRSGNRYSRAEVLALISHAPRPEEGRKT